MFLYLVFLHFCNSAAYLQAYKLFFVHVLYYINTLQLYLLIIGMDEGIMYSCDMCNFKTIRKDMYMLHIVKHKEETLQNNGICEPLVSLDEVRIIILHVPICMGLVVCYVLCATVAFPTP